MAIGTGPVDEVRSEEEVAPPMNKIDYEVDKLLSYASAYRLVSPLFPPNPQGAFVVEKQDCELTKLMRMRFLHIIIRYIAYIKIIREGV